jgi:hypothetical protein
VSKVFSVKGNNAMVARTLIVLTVTLMCMTINLEAQTASPSQYYTAWQYESNDNYWYRLYYYKPYVSYKGWRYSYVIYYPQLPGYYYYYTKYPSPSYPTGCFWGRLTIENDPEITLSKYSLLEGEQRISPNALTPNSPFPATQPIAGVPVPGGAPPSGPVITMEPPPNDRPPGGF